MKAEATFMAEIGYGDILYMYRASSNQRSLDSVHHSFISNAKSLTHHCILCDFVGWTSLSQTTAFLYKALLGKLPKYLSTFLGRYHLRTSKWLLINVPWAGTDLGKTSLSCHAPWSWNKWQKNPFISIHDFKKQWRSVVVILLVLQCSQWALWCSVYSISGLSCLSLQSVIDHKL